MRCRIVQSRPDAPRSVPFAAAAVAIGLAMIAWWGLSPHATRVKVGQMAPDFALPHWNQSDRPGDPGGRCGARLSS